MDAYHGAEVLEAAILKYGAPEIMNSDQGSQYTGNEWIKSCEMRKIKVSHNGTFLPMPLYFLALSCFMMVANRILLRK